MHKTNIRPPLGRAKESNHPEGNFIIMSHHLGSLLARQGSRIDIIHKPDFGGDGSAVFVKNVRTWLAADEIPTGFHDEAHHAFELAINSAVPTGLPAGTVQW